MQKLSVVIITLNEEKNIGRCLESVRGLADETVVVDSFSTDRTEEICLRYGARFIRHPFEGYIEQKSWALGQAVHPWVLSLDADEALSDELRKSLSGLGDHPGAEGYSFNRLTNYCGKWIRHCGWYPDRKLRLVNRNKARWGGVNPHDKLILDAGCRQEHFSGDILHYSYGSLSDHVRQVDHFSGIKAQEAFRKGTGFLWFRMLLHPPFRFVRDYFFKAGFLDGFYGLVICSLNAHSVFLKYAKLKQLRMQARNAKQ